MPAYAVDSKRSPMVATGIVQPVVEWEGPKGNRQPTDRQAKDERTGHGLYLFEVTYRTVMFGRPATAMASVKVPLPVCPEVPPFAPVEFAGLTCDVFVKSGGFEERWSAEAIVSLAGKPLRAGSQAGGS